MTWLLVRSSITSTCVTRYTTYTAQVFIKTIFNEGFIYLFGQRSVRLQKDLFNEERRFSLEESIEAWSNLAKVFHSVYTVWSWSIKVMKQRLQFLWASSNLVKVLHSVATVNKFLVLINWSNETRTSVSWHLK